MVNTDTLLLSDNDVKKCITWEEAFRIAEEVLLAQGNKEVEMPPKMMLKLRPYGFDSYSNVMPTFIQKGSIMGVKWGGGFGKNVIDGSGLPYMMQTLILNDPHTGVAKSIMHASYIVTLKTGCETVVSAKYFAPRKEDLKVMIVGLGDQGTGNIQAWLAAHRLGDLQVQEFLLIDLSDEKIANASKLIADSSSIAVRSGKSTEELAPEADVIVTLTHARSEDLVKYEWLKKGVYVATLGSFGELDPRIHLNADKIVVDSWEQNVHRGEYKRLIAENKITRDRIYGELPELMAQGLGRENPDELISSALIGLGSIDIGYAQTIYENALSQKLGSTFKFIG